MNERGIATTLGIALGTHLVCLGADIPCDTDFEFAAVEGTGFSGLLQTSTPHSPLARLMASSTGGPLGSAALSSLPRVGPDVRVDLGRELPGLQFPQQPQLPPRLRLPGAEPNWPSVQGPPGLPPPRIGPVIPKPKTVWDERTKAVLGDLFKPDPRVQQQSDPIDVKTDAVKLEPMTFSPAELSRQAKSSSCSTAYRSLASSFESNKLAMGFWTEPGYTVADFVNWYFQSDLSDESRQKAAPVIQAQERFDKSCMESNIPTEMNPVLIQRAVGLLMLDSKVFCTALRVSETEVLTARHCVVNPRTGATSNDARAVLAGKAKMWFTYEAEPGSRYEVCKSSLPQTASTGFTPSGDNIRLRTSRTKGPVAPLKWSTTPVKSGSSLYLRGYFHFAVGASGPLERLRSTAAGGCFAHAGGGRCFFHGCQTTPIMSGAPVFKRPEPNTKSDVLEVAGLHLGSALLSDPNGPNGSVCTGVDGTKVPTSNFAYQP